MNDIDKLKNTLNEIGIKFEEKTAIDEYGESPTVSEYDGSTDWDTCIELDNGIGYYDFTCCFYFLDGKSQGHGVWE